MRLSFLIILFLLSSCTLKLRVRGKCEGGIEFNEVSNTCPLKRDFVLEADNEPE